MLSRCAVGAVACGASTSAAMARIGATPSPAQDGEQGQEFFDPPLTSGLEVPTTGALLPGLEFLDPILRRALDAHGIVGMSFAASRNGQLVAARGVGWADLAAQRPVEPLTPFLLASVSKIFTAQSILKAIDEGMLSLDDRAFGFVRDLEPLAGAIEDPRLGEITIRMLLSHTGGWDRRISGDPSTWGPRVRRAFHLRHPPNTMELIRYMKGVPLDFDPGTEAVYSNFGFDLLGVILERVLEERYEVAVRRTLLTPLGVHRPRIALAPPRYLPDEARRYAAGGEHEFPGGHPFMNTPAGGWESSAVDLALLLTGIDGTRTGASWLSLATTQAMLARAPGVELRPNGTYFGLGWDRVHPPESGAPADAASGAAYLNGFDFGKDGDFAGISTWVEHLPLDDGSAVDWVVLLNVSAIHGEPAPIPALQRAINPALRGVQQWPAGDLFPQFEG